MVSALRFREHRDESAYLAKIEHILRRIAQDQTIASIPFKQFESVYHTSIKAQHYLQNGGLGLDILTKAFRGFINLERVTYDRSNDNIGFTQLTNTFGGPVLLSEDLLTFDNLYTLPTLVRALSESKTKVTDLHIGCGYDISRPRFDSYGIAGFSRLTTNALIAAFHHPDMCAHASQVMSEVQTLIIDETDVEDNRHDLLSIAATIKYMTSLSPKLRRIEIEQICSVNHMSNMQLLSIEDLFELHSAYHLQHIRLIYLEIPDCQSIVAFLRHHACTLVHVKLAFLNLMVER